MKLTVLVDNNTYIDQYYLGEPALSFLLEVDGHRILFDTGYSDVLIRNAEAMGIDLGTITEVVLSHGHNDHSRGLKFLAEQFDLSKIPLITHPYSLDEKYDSDEYIGSPYTKETIAGLLQYKPTIQPYFISENCVFCGEIPQFHSFEERRKMGTVIIDNQAVDDYVTEDSAIACMTEKGLVVITACSHSGICNMIEYAKELFHTNTVAAVIGGFHLFEIDERTEKTIDYLSECNIETLYPCHCVSFKVKAEMSRVMNVEEVGVGLVVEI